MTWPGHVVFAGSIALVAGAPVSAWPGVLFGAVFPDWVEMRIIPHRTITHSVVFWLAAAGLVFGLAKAGVLFFGLSLPESLAWTVLKGFFFGVATHLAADSASVTGVPIFFKGPRVALKVYSTGRFSEFVFVSGAVAIALLAIWLSFLA